MARDTKSAGSRRRKDKAQPISFRDIAGNESTLPIMRELAAAAAWKGLTLSGIATKINKDGGYNLAASNVRRFFTVKRSHPETVDLLVGIIGLSARHVALASGEKLKSSEYRAIERDLRLYLAMREADFEVGAVEDGLAAFDGLDADSRIALLSAYELQRQRDHAGMLPAPPALSEDLNDPFIVFATMLYRQTAFHLLSRLQRPNASEDALWNLWLRLLPPLGPFTPREAESIIATAIGQLRLRHVDTSLMEDRLQRKRLALQRAEVAAQRPEDQL